MLWRWEVQPSSLPPATPVDLFVRVPSGVNAGSQFDFQNPDGTYAQVTCPTPFPHGCCFSYRWYTGTRPANPIEVRVPSGVNAGDTFALELADGARKTIFRERWGTR